MKVLWFCNIMLPRIARHLSFEEPCAGGWLTGLSEGLLAAPDIELTAAFPMQGISAVISGRAGNLAYFGFPQKKRDIRRYNKDIEKYAGSIIAAASPDVIHIFGTEFPHTPAIVKACGKLGKISETLINIQGLVSVIAKHYYTALPDRVIHGYTLRDFLRQDNIRQQRNAFMKRGQYEIEALKKIRHVCGRTDWDRACTSMINPHAQYHFCSETLRNEFYKHSRDNSWDIEKCERHSIFISRADYPIKGLHLVLEALPEIIRRYPGTHLYIAGDDITKSGMPLTQRLKITYYGLYIKRLIDKHRLHEHISYTGELGEKEMCARFLKSHVFISASSIENESNSVSEAKMLGVPVAASYAGGVTERLRHHETGFYYQYDAPYMLAHYVCSIFGDDDLALKFSRNAKKHALEIHDREKNAGTMSGIYKAIINDKA